MYRVIYCTLFEHNWTLLLLASLVCAATFVVTGLLWTRLETAEFRRRTIWMCGMGVVVGGGVWATHFIAMLAYKPSLPIEFDLTLTMFSLVLGMALSTSAFLLLHRIRKPMAAGVSFATGVILLHYVGMAAIVAPAQIIWDTDLVFASWLVCLAASVLAMRMGAAATTNGRRALTCFVLALAVVSLHFTGMGAVTLAPDPRIAPPMITLDPVQLSAIVATTVSACLVLVFILVISDMRISQAEAQSWAKSQFLASMSHELRTPLTSIIAYAEMIAETANQEERAQDEKDARVILDASNHLLTLISEILDFSKLEAGALTLELSEVNVSALLLHVRETTAPLTALNGNRFVCDVDDAVGAIVTDQTRLRQCLLNLMSNAAKFTRDGLVTLRAYEHSRLDLPGICFEVIDTGIGISPDAIEHLFRPFTQADETITRRYGGSGLGLAITHQLALRMGGALSVTSKVGVGSSFALWIPRIQLFQSTAPRAELKAVA